MADDTGIDLPDVFRAGSLGDRYLGVIPIAQSIAIDATLVILVAIERCSSRSLILLRMPRRHPVDPQSPLGGEPWPSLALAATDDVGTSYRVTNIGGRGTDTDYLLEFAMAPTIPDEAQGLEIVIDRLSWADVSTWEYTQTFTGPWRFTVDLSSGTPARPT